MSPGLRDSSNSRNSIRKQASMYGSPVASTVLIACAARARLSALGSGKGARGVCRIGAGTGCPAEDSGTGTATFSPHLGHFDAWPAKRLGALSAEEHLGHWKRIASCEAG